MFDPDSIIVGLEIGTSKICAVVGEVNPSGALNIVGLGQARSRGVRKGEIADASTVAEDIRGAIVEAEQMADAEIRSVYLGVTGGHIRGFSNRGVHPVISADREITREDVEDVIKNAKAINLPAENYVLHAIRQHFLVDGQDGIIDPVGMRAVDPEHPITRHTSLVYWPGGDREVDRVVADHLLKMPRGRQNMTAMKKTKAMT